MSRQLSGIAFKNKKLNERLDISYYPWQNKNQQKIVLVKEKFKKDKTILRLVN